MEGDNPGHVLQARTAGRKPIAMPEETLRCHCLFGGQLVWAKRAELLEDLGARYVAMEAARPEEVTRPR